MLLFSVLLSIEVAGIVGNIVFGLWLMLYNLDVAGQCKCWVFGS